MDFDPSDRANLDSIFDRARSDLTWRMLAIYGWQTALMMLMIVAIL
jgi:hypothetical protein